MKRIVSLIYFLLILTSGFSQTTVLGITTDKTTSLIFPFPIIHVDRGTKDLIVQPVKEADNILLVKAASKQFGETNLSVITNDGSVYAFTVSYLEKPLSWIYNVPVQGQVSIQTYAKSILDNPQTIRGGRDEKWKMISRLIGLYTRGDVIYYQLELDNQSNLDYDIDFLRFYMKDKKKTKRVAVQENELKPLHVAGNNMQVNANAHSSIVIAFRRFTIPEGKYLVIEINEKNGGRNLAMKVSNSKIVRAILLPEQK